MTIEDVRRLFAALPGVEEGPCYGTPGFRVAKKLLARLKEDGETLAIKTDLFERDALMSTYPEVLYVTDHYRNYPMVLVRLPAVDAELLEELVEDAWRMTAPRKMVAARNAGSE